MKLRYVLSALAALGVLFAIVVIVRDSRPVATLPVSVPLAKSPYASYVAGSGVIEAGSSNISVGTPVSGIVLDIYVELNDTVETGQALFRIDDRDLQAKLVAAKAMVAETDAALRKPEHQLAFREALRKRDTSAISIEKLTDLRDDVAAAQASLSRAHAQVRQIEREIDRHVVRAPISGTILQIKMRRGEYVEAKELAEPMMVLGDERTLHVRVDVDQQDAWRVHPGAAAVGFDPGNPELRIPLQFGYIEPLIVPKRSLMGRSTERADTRVLQVIYSFKRNQLPLYTGQQLDVYIDAAAEARDARE